MTNDQAEMDDPWQRESETSNSSLPATQHDVSLVLTKRISRLQLLLQVKMLLSLVICKAMSKERVKRGYETVILKKPRYETRDLRLTSR